MKAIKYLNYLIFISMGSFVGLSGEVEISKPSDSVTTVSVCEEKRRFLDLAASM